MTLFSLNLKLICFIIFTSKNDILHFTSPLMYIVSCIILFYSAPMLLYFSIDFFNSQLELLT